MLAELKEHLRCGFYLQTVLGNSRRLFPKETEN
jgi:hypothetical protein